MQAEAGRKVSLPEPLSESEKRHFSKYEKVPLRGSVGSEGWATLSSGDHARPATENDAMQLRESFLREEITSPSGSPVINASSFHNEAVGDPYRNFPPEKRLSQPFKSNTQDPAFKEQRFKSVSEEHDSVLFPFD